jgi:hypothetical protein
MAIESVLINEEIDWQMINTLANIALTGALVGITWWYANQIEKRAHADRLQKEMDLLVSPLYAKSQGILKPIYFIKGSPGYFDSGRIRDREYFDFWDNILRNKYLGPNYLQVALDNYMKNKTNEVSVKTRDPEYEEAEKYLIEMIIMRYKELQIDM